MYEVKRFLLMQIHLQCLHFPLVRPSEYELQYSVKPPIARPRLCLSWHQFLKSQGCLKDAIFQNTPAENRPILFGIFTDTIRINIYFCLKFVSASVGTNEQTRPIYAIATI